jgi:hypothetical protein
MVKQVYVYILWGHVSGPYAEQKEGEATPYVPYPPAKVEIAYGRYVQNPRWHWIKDIQRGDTFQAVLSDTTYGIWQCNIIRATPLDCQCLYVRASSPGYQTSAWQQLYVSPGKQSKLDFDLIPETVVITLK